MAEKQKKPLTTKQKQTRYRVLQYASIGGIFASIFTPFIILGAINFEDWFVANEGWRIGLGGTLGLAVAGIAAAMVTFKKEKESKVTDGWITFIVCWFAVGFTFRLLEEIYHQIFTIMMWTGLGLCVAFGFNIFSNVEKKNADAYKEARKKIKQESIEEQARREVQKELEEEEDRPVE